MHLIGSREKPSNTSTAKEYPRAMQTGPIPIGSPPRLPWGKCPVGPVGNGGAWKAWKAVEVMSWSTDARHCAWHAACRASICGCRFELLVWTTSARSWYVLKKARTHAMLRAEQITRT